MSHIFISYSHKDTDYAQKFQEALIQEGFEVWIDDRIEYGDEWPMVIQERLDACDVFILIATENSYRSKWVHKEVTRAQRTEKPFFPLLLNGHPWLTIESTQYVDVRDQSLPTERFYKKLARYTSRNKPTPAPQPQPPTPTPTPIVASASTTTPSKSTFTALRDVFSKAKTLPFFGIAGLIVLVLALLWGGSWLVSILNASPQGPGADYPFVFSVETGDEVNVYSYDMNSNRLSLVGLGPGKNWDPTYSGLGNLYFTSNREEGKAEIYRFVNGVPERVTYAPGQYQSWDPAFSPNGTLYFTCNQFDGKAEICRLVDEETVRVTQTPGDFQSWGPVISATGTVYYTSNREHKREVYKLVNAEPQSVTDTPGNYESWGPAISPLTGAVYFTSNRGDGRAEIYRLASDADADPVTDTPASYQSWGPVIASDGTIYYTSTKENGIRQVFRLVDRVSQPLPYIPGQAQGFTDILTGILPAY